MALHRRVLHPRVVAALEDEIPKWSSSSGRNVDVAGDATAAIAGLAVGLELVDLGRPPGDLEGIIAGNVFHRAFALGQFTPITLPLGLILSGSVTQVSLAAGDEVRAEIDGLGSVALSVEP